MHYEEYYYDEGDMIVEKEVGEPTSLDDLQYTQNDEAFYNLGDIIFLKHKAILYFEIEDGVALYRVDCLGDASKKIFLSKEIAQAVREVLKNGKNTTSIKDWIAVDKNVDENYMLHLIKKNQQDGAMRYRQSTGEIIAVYPLGEINYGKHYLEELKEKLNTLV